MCEQYSITPKNISDVHVTIENYMQAVYITTTVCSYHAGTRCFSLVSYRDVPLSNLYDGGKLSGASSNGSKALLAVF